MADLCTLWQETTSLLPEVISLVFQYHECEESEIIDLCSNARKLPILETLLKLKSPIFQNKKLLQRGFQTACAYGIQPILVFLANVLTVDDMRANENGAIYMACTQGHLETVEFLLQFLDVDDVRSQHNRSFFGACAKGHTQIVKRLSCVYKRRRVCA